ncbi:hypothetical protein LTR53_019973, partial [Teratosphaeriaceae sp. CCFEE 6253]
RGEAGRALLRAAARDGRGGRGDGVPVPREGVQLHRHGRREREEGVARARAGHAAVQCQSGRGGAEGAVLDAGGWESSGCAEHTGQEGDQDWGGDGGAATGGADGVPGDCGGRGGVGDAAGE